MIEYTVIAEPQQWRKNCSAVLEIGGQHMRFPAQEYWLFEILSRHRPNFVNRDAMIYAIWGEEECETADKVLSVLKTKLCKRIRAFGADIESAHGCGYRMVEG